MWNQFTMWLVVLVPVAMALVVGFSKQYKSLPRWFHKTAEGKRSVHPR